MGSWKDSIIVNFFGQAYGGWGSVELAKEENGWTMGMHRRVGSFYRVEGRKDF